jgi:hypothetical protein
MRAKTWGLEDREKSLETRRRGLGGAKAAPGHALEFQPLARCWSPIGLCLDFSYRVVCPLREFSADSPGNCLPGAGEATTTKDATSTLV